MVEPDLTRSWFPFNNDRPAHTTAAPDLSVRAEPSRDHLIFFPEPVPISTTVDLRPHFVPRLMATWVPRS